MTEVKQKKMFKLFRVKLTDLMCDKKILTLIKHGKLQKKI